MGRARLGDLSHHSLEACMIILSIIVLVILATIFDESPGLFWIVIGLSLGTYILLYNL